VGLVALKDLRIVMLKRFDECPKDEISC
jgi:hypothetical protein